MNETGLYIRVVEMRETTKLLTEHMPQEIALLVEQMIGAPVPNSDLYYRYFFIILGGHRELIETGACAANANEMLKGGAATSDVALICRALDLGASQANSAIVNAAAHEADNEVFTVLAKYCRDNYLRIPNYNVLAHAASKNNLRIIEHAEYLGIKDYNVVLAFAASHNHLRLMQWAFNRGANGWNHALYHCASLANRAMSLMCLHNGANANSGLAGACSMGYEPQMRLVQLFIERGATNFEQALSEACEGGFQSAVDLMIECGATWCRCNRSIHAHKELHSDDK